MSMRMSANTDEVFSAYIKSRSIIAPIYKDSNGFKSKYADLPKIVEVIQKAAYENDLAFSQACGKIKRFTPMMGKDKHGNDVLFGEPNHIICIDNMLMHSSGQWMSSVSEFVVDSNMPSRTQNCGATITYARRYGALAFWFMAAEDEIDGEPQGRAYTSSERTNPKADRVEVYDLATLKGYISKASDPRKTELHIINSHKGNKINSLDELDEVSIASWCHTLYMKMQEGK